MNVRQKTGVFRQKETFYGKAQRTEKLVCAPPGVRNG